MLHTWVEIWTTWTGPQLEGSSGVVAQISISYLKFAVAIRPSLLRYAAFMLRDPTLNGDVIREDLGE